MVGYGTSLKQRFVAGAVAASLVLPPAQVAFGQDRRLAVNTPVAAAIIPNTVTFGGIELSVITLDRSIAQTDATSAQYRTGGVRGERWRDRLDGTIQSDVPNGNLAYYRNMVIIRETGGADGLRVLYSIDARENKNQFGAVYTNARGGDSGVNQELVGFSQAYRTATNTDLRRVRLFVQHGENSRGEEQYVVFALPANEQTGQLTGRQTISGVSGYPGVAIVYYPNRVVTRDDGTRETGTLGNTMHIFVRDQ